MAVEKIRKALAEGVRCIVVTGSAGTGKTTLIRDLVPVLSAMRYDVLLLAPTGRAAKMIQVRTGHPASTIHSAIFRIDDKPKEGTAEDGDLRWVFPLKGDRPARTAFVVDEASMVGSALHNDGILQFGTGSLLQDLLKYSGIGHPGSDNIVVFVGDPFQLPPVGEKPSDPPALDVSNLEGLIGFRVVPLRLEKVHRQREGSGILEEAGKLRTAISYHAFGMFGLAAHDDIHPVDESQFEQLYHPEENLNDKVVIAYTNVRVWEFNCRVRAMLGMTGDTPVPGERLLSLRNTIVPVGDGRESAFMNGDMLHVIEVDADRTVKLTGFYRPKGKDEALAFEFTFVRMKLAWLYEFDREDADVWVNVTPILSEAYREHPEYASLALYVAVSEQIRRRFKLGRSKEDDQKVREQLKASRLYHAPLVTYGYAITGHKAQGGEWNEVWIDYRYTQNRMTEGYFRWMYTALTRARRIVFALSPPAFDDIAEALARGLERTEAMSPALTMSAGAVLPLAAILARHGYAAVETSKKPYLVRVSLARAGDPFADSGRLEMNFNGKGIVSYVRLACPGASDDFGRDVAALKGRSIRSVLPEGGRDDAASEVEIAVVEPHVRIRDRLCAAAERAGLRVLSMKSLTPNQLRLGLASELGDGYVDFYIDAAGRVTEMGSMTMPRAGLERLKEGLAG